MNPTTLSAVESTFAASSAGSIHFGRFVGRLMETGVAAYHVDYRAGRSTYCLPDGETHVERFPA